MTLGDDDLPAASILRRPRRRDFVYYLEPLLNTGSPLVYDFCSSLATNTYNVWIRVYKLGLHCIVSVLRLLVHGCYWLLPQWTREFLVDAAVAGSLFAFFAAIHAAKHRRAQWLSGWRAGAALLGACCWAGFKIAENTRRENVIFGRLRMQKFYRQRGQSYIAVLRQQELEERQLRARELAAEKAAEEALQTSAGLRPKASASFKSGKRIHHNNKFKGIARQDAGAATGDPASAVAPTRGTGSGRSGMAEGAPDRKRDSNRVDSPSTAPARQHPISSNNRILCSRALPGRADSSPCYG